MTRNEFEQLVDRCLAGDITGSKAIEIIDYDTEKQLLEGEYIYLENIALKCFGLIYSQIIKDLSGWLLIKKILSGEKSWFFSSTMRMPSDNTPFIPSKAKWLLDLVHDSEWRTLREIIIQYRETRFLSSDIREKYWEIAYKETSESDTIIDLMKKIIYHHVSQKWFVEDAEGIEHFQLGGMQLGERADLLDFTNKLLRIIDFCQGKTFFIVGVNYQNGHPIISLLS